MKLNYEFGGKAQEKREREGGEPWGRKKERKSSSNLASILLRFCGKKKERTWFVHQTWLELGRKEELVDCGLSFILVWKEKEVKILDHPSFFVLSVRQVNLVNFVVKLIVNLEVISSQWTLNFILEFLGFGCTYDSFLVKILTIDT